MSSVKFFVTWFCKDANRILEKKKTAGTANHIARMIGTDSFIALTFVAT